MRWGAGLENRCELLVTRNPAPPPRRPWQECGHSHKERHACILKREGILMETLTPKESTKTQVICTYIVIPSWDWWATWESNQLVDRDLITAQDTNARVRAVCVQIATWTDASLILMASSSPCKTKVAEFFMFQQSTSGIRTSGFWTNTNLTWEIQKFWKIRENPEFSTTEKSLQKIT